MPAGSFFPTGQGAGQGAMNPLLGLAMAAAQSGKMPPMGSMPGIAGAGGGASPQPGQNFMGQPNPGPPQNAGFMTPGGAAQGQGKGLDLASVAGALQPSQGGQQMPPAAGAGGPGGSLSPNIMTLLAQLMQGQGPQQMPTLGNLIAGR